MSDLAAVDRFEILDRLNAIVSELEPGGDGPEVATALARGLLEELGAELEGEARSERGDAAA